MAKLPSMPNAENCSLAELEVAARAAPSKRSHLRLMAIRALFLGIGHDPVASLFSITRRTLSNWIKRFNEQGIDDLIERPRPGRPRKISPEQGATTGNYWNIPNTPIRRTGPRKSSMAI